MQNEITHPVAVALIKNLIDLIPSYQSGTYNRQDPTHYEKGETEVLGLKLQYYDVSWGVELSICSYTGKELARIYLSHNMRQPNSLIPRDSWSNNWFAPLKLMYNKLRSDYAEQHGVSLIEVHTHKHQPPFVPEYDHDLYMYI